MSRLEQIKTNWENGHMNTSDGDWLINRVEELEEKNLQLVRENNQVNDELIEEYKRAERYKKALEEIKNFTPVQDTDSVVEIKGIAEEALK